MRLKTLLKTLEDTNYCLVAPSGWMLEENFIGSEYYGESRFENAIIDKIFTTQDSDTLYVVAKKW